MAIHGINGHCIDSWKGDKTGTYWLRDLLPDKLPHARIMTFQYDGKVVGNKNAYGVDGIAEQLLGLLVRYRGDVTTAPLPTLFFYMVPMFRLYMPCYFLGN